MQEFSGYIKAFHLDFVVFVGDAHVELGARVGAHNGTHVSRDILDQGLQADGVNVSVVSGVLVLGYQSTKGCMCMVYAQWRDDQT